ncbi:MAG TPA: hypothetical protein VLM85_31670 [Polyangiaceae bacterium]|nr:hypothetical protein [Polyangiaceae bacterium]
MTLAHVLYPAAQAAVVVPFSRPQGATSSAHWSEGLLVLDSRLAVAEECARALGRSPQGREVRRCLEILAGVRDAVEALFATLVAAEERSGSPLAAAREYVAAVCRWAADVAASLREIASEDECRWSRVRERAARVSSARVRGDLVPLFAELEAERPRPSPTRSAALALQGDVVLLNWNLRG